MADHLSKSTLTGGIALFEVGHDKAPFSVHKELLCECSARYKRIFEGRAKLELNGHARYVFREEALLEVEPDVFAELIGWIYRGSLSTALERRVPYTFLLNLWILANSFEMPKLEAAVIFVSEQKAKQQKHEGFQSSTISLVYEKTVPGSPLWQFVVSACAERASSARFAQLKNMLPAEFCRDLCQMLIVKAEAAILHEPVDSSSKTPRPVVRLPGQNKRNRSDSSDTPAPPAKRV